MMTQNPHNTNPDPGWSDALIERLEEQGAVVRELGALAVQQGALVGDDDLEPLLQLLADRQTLIERFAELQSSLAVLTDQLESRMPQLDDGRRDRIRHLIGDVGRGLNEVMGRDELAQRALARSEDGRASNSPEQNAREAYLRHRRNDTSPNEEIRG